MEGIKEGLEEVTLFKNGKLKTTPAKDFLNEINKDIIRLAKTALT